MSQSAARGLPWRLIVFLTLLVAYVLVTLGVLFHSPILDWDDWIRRLHLQRRWEGWYERVDVYVMLGQRGPTTLLALPWIAWMAWRGRSARPLLLLGTALLVLNLSVGIVKLITGRLGPLDTRDVHDIFAGGNIYPSGHVSNTVVLYGVIAMIATKYRRTVIGAGIWISLSVGVATLYLNTHWLSDVIGGWLAGGLVLVALPWLLPTAERITAAAVARIRRVRDRCHARPAGELAEDALAQTGLSRDAAREPNVPAEAPRAGALAGAGSRRRATRTR